MSTVWRPRRFRKTVRQGGARHIGQIADGLVYRIGRRAISFHLSRAAETTGMKH